MSVAFLILSAILFWATFGIHSNLIITERYNQKLVLSKVLLKIFSICSSFILPVISLKFVLNIHWVFVFIICLAIVWLIGPIITKVFINGSGMRNRLDYLMLYTFIVGLIFLFIGQLTR